MTKVTVSPEKSTPPLFQEGKWYLVYQTEKVAPTLVLVLGQTPVRSRPAMDGTYVFNATTDRIDILPTSPVPYRATEVSVTIGVN